MNVKRIVANVETPDPAAVARFYKDILGLDLLMDHGWIATYGVAGSTMPLQVSFASEGGSGTPVPGLSIEVDDVTPFIGSCSQPVMRSNTGRRTSPGACGASSCAIRPARSSISSCMPDGQVMAPTCQGTNSLSP